VKDKTGGQKGDPLEMWIFNLTIHHLWGRVKKIKPVFEGLVRRKVHKIWSESNKS
jgi:hypothetical protein